MPTKEQLDAFEKYDFASDDRWINYYNNLTIPPGRSDGAAIVRRYKQKFYKKFVDSSFEVETLGESAQSTSRSSQASSSSSGATGPPRAAPSASASARAGGPPPAGQWSRAQGPRGPSQIAWASTQFLLNAFVVVMAVVAIFPLTPAYLAVRCFRLSLVGSVVASILSLVTTYGTPSALQWDAIKLWLQRCSSGPEILTILHCAAFLPSPKPAVLAALPVACHLAPAVAEHLQQNYSRAQLYQSYLEKACTWLIQNKTQVNLFAANMEISLGFLVVFFLFTPQRNILLIFFYWQILRLEYHSPASAWYHQQVWAQLGRQVVPYIQQYAPFALGPLEYAKKWFTQVGR